VSPSSSAFTNCNWAFRISLADKISKVERQTSAGEGLASVNTPRKKEEWFFTVNIAGCFLGLIF
jgi:hypothetical protein